jgi:uncharacterized membrane protein
MKTYRIQDSSAIGQKGCLICHRTEDDYTQMNPYGRDLKKALADTGADELNVNILMAVGAIDSTNSGKPNELKIIDGEPPGDVGKGKVDFAEPRQPKPKRLIPKNFFHPAIVHFPIGLFIASLLFDFLGVVLKRKELLLCGWYNIVLAAISSLGGIATGFGAMYIQKLPFKGVIFQHMVLALTAAVLMSVMVAMRVHRHEKLHLPGRLIYYALAAVGFVLISYAGHLGGSFVYGE